MRGKMGVRALVLGALVLASTTSAVRSEATGAEQTSASARRAAAIVDEAGDDATEAALLAEQAEKESAATKQFLGASWSLGVGVVADLESGSRVEKASVVNGVVRVDEAKDIEPRILLEIHLFGLPRLVKGLDENCKNSEGDEVEGCRKSPLFGQGPWVGIQTSQDDLVDSFGLGWMWGWRKSVTETSSFNLGLGIVLDPNVEVLGDGIEADKPLPTGETDIRLKKESRLGAVLLASFSFQ